MRHITLFLLTIFLGGSLAHAQKKALTLEDAVLNIRTSLAPENLKQLAWQPETNHTFTYVKDDTLIGQDVKTGSETSIISLTGINEIIENHDIDPLKKFPKVTWHNNHSFYFFHNGYFLLLDITANTLLQVVTIPDHGAHHDISPDASMVAYTVGENLHFANAEKNSQVTSDGGKGIVYGQSVHRDEFGITKGIFWSPKSGYLAFYRKDESMVKEYPLVDYMKPQAEHTPIHYHMAGGISHQVTVGVYNIKTGETIYLNTPGPKDHYLTNISWGPEEKYIYIQELNRGQDHMKMNQYDARTGEFVKTLFEERKKHYVEPLAPIVFSKVNTDIFYYQSRRDGFKHVYKYNTDGTLIRQLTKGNWEVTSIVGFDPKEHYLFAQTTTDSPLERHIYKIDTRNGKMLKLSTEEGTHKALLSSQANYITDSYQSLDIPRKIDLITTKGKVVRNLLTAKNPLEGYALGENEIITLKSGDGKTDIYGRLILPPDFDPNKKYPAIVYVYGGPHLQLVQKNWHNKAKFWEYYMAEKGYIIFTLDNRGSANRGDAFESVIYGQLGKHELVDQMIGIDYLKSLPYVDHERLGVHGWSFGGFMAINMMVHNPGTFKVGITGGTVINWGMFEVMYTERYMETPAENPEGYRESNMLNHVALLEDRLLLIHGMQDGTVTMQQSIKFIRECIKEGKQIDFFVYPTHQHNVFGKDRVHMMEKICRYYIENL